MALEAQQIRKLKAPLRSRHIRTREVDGRTLSYVEGWHVIAEANRIFGFDGWDRELVEQACVYTKQLGDRFNAAYTARIRVTVQAGERSIVREGSGAGEASASSPGQAHELAMKAAETDATKRALMTFGNAFGLSLYGPAKEQVQRPVSVRDRSKSEKPGPSTITAKPEQHGKSENDTTPASVEMASLVQAERQPVSAHMKVAEAPELARSRPTFKIDKSVLAISEPRRFRDPEHLRFVASKGCLVCGKNRSQAHHLRFTQPSAMARKVSDEFTVPLCPDHHRDLHRHGDEQAWWRLKAIDAVAVAAKLWAESQSRSIARPSRQASG
jgi:DNA recombination protein Rad52